MTARSLATRPAPAWATTCNAQQHCHTTFGPTVTCQHEIDKGSGGAGSLLDRCVFGSTDPLVRLYFPNY